MIQSLITPMNFDIASSAISEALAQERDFQLELAHRAGIDNEAIKIGRAHV